ncbi:hypothetical protein, partial [Daejeonella sp.]|uniref:hypothetical protein n=1 Tax=Daejeonella sp. TaxID=2805397 RepID=UPI0030BBD47A
MVKYHLAIGRSDSSEGWNLQISPYALSFQRRLEPPKNPNRPFRFGSRSNLKLMTLSESWNLPPLS